MHPHHESWFFRTTCQKTVVYLISYGRTSKAVVFKFSIPDIFLGFFLPQRPGMQPQLPRLPLHNVRIPVTIQRLSWLPPHIWVSDGIEQTAAIKSIILNFCIVCSSFKKKYHHFNFFPRNVVNPQVVCWYDKYFKEWKYLSGYFFPRNLNMMCFKYVFFNFLLFLI